MIIPLLGVISANVAQAPFQLNPATVNEYNPLFNNRSNQFTQSYNNNGYWGLRGMFTSISPWGSIEPTNGNGISQVAQLSAFSINSFGIYYYRSLLANPTQYRALGSYASEYNIIESLSSLYFVSPSQNAPANNLPLVVNKVYCPALLFENLSNNNPVLLSKNQYVGAPGYFYYPYFNANMSLLDPLLKDTVPLFYARITGNPTWFATQPTNDLGQGPPQVWNSDETNPLWAEAVYVPECTGIMVNPANGITIYKFGSNNLTALNCIVPKNGNFASYENINFSDATDDINFNTGGTGDVAPYVPVMTPGGNFFLKSTIAESYVLISANLSGYYRINFNPQSTLATQAVFSGIGSNFGIDLNGNVWFLYQGILYSNLQLGTSIYLNGFPNLSLAAMGCNRLNSQTRFIFEG